MCTRFLLQQKPAHSFHGSFRTAPDLEATAVQAMSVSWSCVPASSTNLAARIGKRGSGQSPASAAQRTAGTGKAAARLKIAICLSNLDRHESLKYSFTLEWLVQPMIGKCLRC